MDADMTLQDPEVNEVEEKRHRQPFFYCTFICNRPKTAFSITLGGHIGFLLLNFILALTPYNIFPADFYHFPVHLKDELVAQREYAWKYRNNETEHIDRIIVDNLGPTWYRGYSADDVKLYFTCWGGNVFTKEIFKAMEDIEYGVFNLTDYQTSYCQLDETQNCIKPHSILRYFDGTYQNVDPIFYDPEYNNINQVLYTAYSHTDTMEEFLYFLGKDYRLSPTESVCSLTRTSIPMGWPLEGNDTDTEKQNRAEDYLLNEVQDAIIRGSEGNKDTVETCYFSFKLFELTIMAQALKDLLLAIGSLTFIFLFIWFQTKSLWITGWGVFSIFSCFWITNVIYRVVLDFTYIGYFHMISIFIILGIGADDFFVFFNAWRDTGCFHYASEAHRLSDCYRHSASTMFFTSFTTMMAFLVSGVSPVLPISTFGIFTGILIAVNYISVIVFFPVVVYTHHIFYYDKKGVCCCTKPKVQPMEMCELHDKAITTSCELQVVTNEINTVSEKTCKTEEHLNTNGASPNANSAVPNANGAIPNANGAIPNANGAMPNAYDAVPNANGAITNTVVQANPTGTKIELEKQSKISIFFAGPYVDAITHPVVRLSIIVTFLLLVGFMAWSSTRLEIDPEEIKIYRASTNFGKAMRYGGSGFVPSGDSFVKLHLVCGMHPRDYSYCHKTDYLCPGIQRWDDTFTVNTPPTQFAFQEFCHKLKYELTAEELEKLMIRNNSDGSGLAVDCFIDNLQIYLETEEARFNDTLSLDYPLIESNMVQYMEDQPLIYNTSALLNTFYRYFEIAIGNWLNNHYLMLSTPDFITFDALIGENIDDPNSQPVSFQDMLFNRTLAYYGTRLRYAGIRVNLSLSTQELSYVVGLPVMNNWENFFNEQLADMPAELRNAFQQTDITWHWLTLQKTLAVNAVFGIVTGLLIALPVLILATLNWIIGLIATINLCCVTICVLGVIPMAGWKVDVMISMNLCLVVGLSIDYIVHLAEAYHLSPNSSRVARVRDMLQHLGSSVLSGAATTLGAAMFMLFAKIQFFLQFGTFLVCTIGFSLLFSMVLFTTVMAFTGPQGKTGSILPPFVWIKNRVIGRSKKDEDCQTCQGRGFLRNEEQQQETYLLEHKSENKNDAPRSRKEMESEEDQMTYSHL